MGNSKSHYRRLNGKTVASVEHSSSLPVSDHFCVQSLCMSLRQWTVLATAARPPRSFIRSSGQILLPRYLMNGLSNLDETYRKYSIAPIDDLIRLWRSKVKVTAGRRCGEGIHVTWLGASTSVS